jgi:hypothetical protein
VVKGHVTVIAILLNLFIRRGEGQSLGGAILGPLRNERFSLFRECGHITRLERYCARTGVELQVMASAHLLWLSEHFNWVQRPQERLPGRLRPVLFLRRYYIGL